MELQIEAHQWVQGFRIPELNEDVASRAVALLGQHWSAERIAKASESHNLATICTAYRISVDGPEIDGRHDPGRANVDRARINWVDEVVTAGDGIYIDGIGEAESARRHLNVELTGCGHSEYVCAAPCPERWRLPIN